jgi:hypothetical protein
MVGDVSYAGLASFLKLSDNGLNPLKNRVNSLPPLQPAS